VSANILSTVLFKFFFGWSLTTTYITKKAFETARLVMRNVDFDEKEAAILEHVLPKEKMAKRSSV
jgi:hypothetical protein